jgi:hypothetical protein
VNAPLITTTLLFVFRDGQAFTTTIGAYASQCPDPEAIESLRWDGSIRLGHDWTVRRVDRVIPSYSYRRKECRACRGSGRAYRGSLDCYGCSGLGFDRFRDEEAAA